MSSFRLATSIALGCVLAACAGPEEDLFGNGTGGGSGADGGAGPSGTPAGSGGAPTTTGGPTGTGPGATSGPGGSTTGSATSTGPGGATTGSGSVGTSVGSGDPSSTSSGDPATSSATSGPATSAASTTAATSASTGVDPQTIVCADQVCSVEGNGACCWNDFFGQAECVEGPPDMDDCQTDFGGFESRIECLAPSDCDGGQLCCGERDFFQQNGQEGAWYVTVECAFECDDVELCEPGVTDCECVPSQLLPTGTYVCRD